MNSRNIITSGHCCNIINAESDKLVSAGFTDKWNEDAGQSEDVDEVLIHPGNVSAIPSKDDSSRFSRSCHVGNISYHSNTEVRQHWAQDSAWMGDSLGLKVLLTKTTAGT